MLPHDTFTDHTGLLKNPTGRLIPDKVVGVYAVQIQDSGSIVYDCHGSFGGVPPAPPGFFDPIAGFTMPVPGIEPGKFRDPGSSERKGRRIKSLADMISG